MKLPQNRTARRTIYGVLGLFALGMLFSTLGIDTRRERALLDLRYRAFNRATPSSSRVLVIDIDEQSMRMLGPHLGRWPWPRRVYKDLVEFVSQGEPTAILFDLLFTEPQLRSTDDSDLAEVTRQRGYVWHAMNLLGDRSEELPGAAKLPDGFHERFALKWSSPPTGFPAGTSEYREAILPTEALLKDSSRLQVVAFNNDDDGLFRRAPLLFRYGDTWLPSLSLAGVLAAYRNPMLRIDRRKLTILENWRVVLTVPFDEKGTLPLHFYRPDQAPKSIPFSAIMAMVQKFHDGEPVDTSEFKDKIIIVGASAVGLNDLKPTPTHASFPGARLQATAISNMLSGDHLRVVPFWIQALILLLLLAITYPSVLLFERVSLKVLVPCTALVVHQAIAIAIFRRWGLQIDMFLPALMGLLSLVDGLAYDTLVEGAEKRRLKKSLSSYVSPAVAEKIIASGLNPAAEIGQQKELTVFFSDIRGFTTLAEKTEAIVIVAELNAYLGVMAELVFKFHGTLDKFMGDAVMAFWGAPLPDDDHPLNAVLCALEMQRALKGSPFKTGIGINTGNVIVGNIGNERRLNYTVIGDNVNLASRVEGLTKLYGVECIVGPITAAATWNRILYRCVDEVRVAGRSQHAKLYEPLAEKTQGGNPSLEAMAERSDIAFTAYQAGDFKRAIELYAAVDRSREGGDALSRVYIERCQKFLLEPPAEWKGVYVARSK